MRDALVGCGIAVLLLALALPARAEVNVEGTSGLLSIPTAEVVQEGDVVFSLGRYLNDTALAGEENVARSHSATAGYLPGLEITARWADFPGTQDPMGATNFMDRSVSLKYQLWADEDWSTAVGAVDIGGQSQLNKAVYGVATYHGIPDWELTAGFGSDKLEGLFGGVRWAPSQYGALLAEYNREQFNYGVELHPRHDWTLKGGWVNEHPAFTASYEFPLDPRGKELICEPVVLARCEAEFAEPCEQAAAVRDALVAQSFENVLAGVAGDTLIVEYENRRYREQLDGLAVAAALAVEHSTAAVTRLVLTPKLDDVPQLTMTAGMDELTAFLAQPDALPAGIVVDLYQPGSYPAGAIFAAESNRKPGGGEVMLRAIESFEITRPGQPTFASKTGLGLEERYFLGRGLSFTARQDWYFHNDLDGKTAPRNRDAWLTYSDAWRPDLLVQVKAGYNGYEKYAGLGEVAYYPGNGRFKIGGRYGYLRGTGADSSTDGLALGILGYYEPELDWQVTALGGQFIAGDQGLQVESTRYFGPTSLTFFAYDTDASKTHGGVRFEFAMPWFDDRKHDHWRVDGSPYFPYQYRTDSHGWGGSSIAGADLEAARQRLRPEYVREHLAEMRRAISLFLSGD